MIKNKDGSYNTFRLLIASLIFIILISITVVYISQQIEIPKIETPSWITPTPTQSPTPTPIPIDSKIADVYNGNASNISWNWSYTNFTNMTNWTPPQEFITDTHNITFVAGGGGGSNGTFSTNGSYVVVAGGGGSGGMGYTGIVYTNSTYTPNTTISIEPTPEITYNLSQNISAVIGQPLAPIGITNPWLVMIILGLPLVLLFSSRSVSSVFPVMFGFLMIGMFLKLEFWSIVAMIILIPVLMIIFSDR